MKSEYRGLLAVALSAAFFFLWMKYFSPPPSAPERAGTAASSPSSPVQNPIPPSGGPGGKIIEEPGEKGQIDPQAKLPEKSVTIRNTEVEIDLTTDGAAATSWKILSYKKGTEIGSSPIDLGFPKAEGVELPLSLGFEHANFIFPKRPRFQLVASDNRSAEFLWRSNEIEVRKKISLAEKGYIADVAVEIKGLSGKAVVGNPALLFTGVVMPHKVEGVLGFLKQPSPDTKSPILLIDGSVKRENNLSKLSERTEQSGLLMWSGIESRYFLGAVIPRVQGEGLGALYGSADLKEGERGARSVMAGAILPQLSAADGAVTKGSFSVYGGPKEIDELKSAGVRLESAIDYGWFSLVAVPILYVLKFFHGILGNYGLAIILLTILVKMALQPINVKSLKSMKEMQKLQPKIKELQGKHKDDKNRLNQETMQLFKAHKVNPMGGCWPMLLQFPIYIALYKVLWNSIELYHAPFFGFYKDLAAPDPYFITPILLGIFMVAQQKLMPSATADPAQQKMMMVMPVMFSVFMLFLPVGLVVYILINTSMSVTQQWMYNKGIRYRDLIRGRWQPQG